MTNHYEKIPHILMSSMKRSWRFKKLTPKATFRQLTPLSSSILTALRP